MFNGLSKQSGPLFNNQYSTEGLTALRTKLVEYPTGIAFLLTTKGSAELVAPAIELINQVSAERGLLIDKAPQVRE